VTSASERSHKRRRLLLLPAAGGFMLITLPVVLLGGVATQQCAPPPAPGGEAAGTGSWIATAYGPPWDAMNGTGVTATGLNLTAGPPAYEIAVDPAVIPLQTFAHVQPNPFGTTRAFYAGDTGGAIIGRHVDIYDWKGRTDQNAWGIRQVNVTPAPNPGAGNLIQEITPGPTTLASSSQPDANIGSTAACDQLAATATLATVPGQTARILADGTAAAPSDAPAAVKLVVAAANEIHTKPYPEPVAHFGSLASPWPAYDCSGAVSFVLYAAGLHSPAPDVSGALESWGAPGPGTWITVYANSRHTWIVIAGLAFDTADYGGPNIPAGSGPRWRQDPLGNLADGLTYVARHPPGL
jgi:3D (Asp-Asp-Asp) domain-containing protein